MVGPRDFSGAELEQFGLGIVERRTQTLEVVRRLYCLRCGSQVHLERRDSDPNGWWACVRGCNTRFANPKDGQPPRPVPQS
ncbi:MAG TPA: hypothetical protein VGK26_02465 [Thermoanaerobaculia bacterium]|jgi:hypothetical protein